MSFIFRSTLLLFLSLSINASLYAQRAVQLTNLQTGKKLKLITEGHRVTYTLKNSNGTTQAITGRLSDITYTELTVNGVTFPIKELEKFGRNKSGSGFSVFILSFFGSALFFGSLKPTTAGNDAGKIITAGVGTSLLYFGINTIVKNSPRNLEVWDIEVVD